MTATISCTPSMCSRRAVANQKLAATPSGYYQRELKTSKVAGYLCSVRDVIITLVGVAFLLLLVKLAYDRLERRARRSKK